MDSILDSVKKLLDIDKDYGAFDTNVVMHINSVFATLHQMGIGPDTGYAIEDATSTWQDFLGNDPRLNDVKVYTYMKIKVLFDAPQQWHLMNAMQEQIKELEFRISVKRENESWTPGTPPQQQDPEVIIVPVSDAWYRE